MQTQTSDGTGVLRLDTLRAGIYSNIYVTLNGCPSKPVRDVTLVDPNPPATPVIIGVDSICSGKSLILTAASPITGGIYTWIHPNGSTSIGTSYTVANTTLNDNGSYKLYVTLNLCKSNDTSFNVRLDSTPIAPIVTSNSPVCTDSTIKLYANTVYPMVVTYTWSGVNSFASSLQNPTISAATLSMNGNYTVYVASVVGKCQSQSSTNAITINESPNVAAMPDTTYKDGVPSGLIAFAGSVAGTTFSWTNSNPLIGLAANGTGDISFTTSNTTPFPIFGIITVTPSTNFCTGKPISFKITVNPTPRLTSPPADTICTDNLWLYQATSATPNVRYTWVRNAVSGISNPASASADSSGIINEILTNTTSQPITVPYIFKLYSLGSVNTDTVKLTVNPDAKASYTFKNDKLCAPGIIDTGNIKVQPFALANGSFEWYADGVLIGTGVQFPTYTILNNGDTVKIKLKANSLYGCKSDSFEHSFYNVKTPVAAFTKSIANGCGPLVVDFQNTTTPLAYPTYKWDFGNGTTSTQQSPANIIFKEDTSNRRVDTTYYIKLTAYTECDSISYIDSVTVFPKPKALFQPDTTVGCSIFKFRAFNNSWGQHNTYTWDFGDSTALVIDTAYGYYYHNFYTAVTDTFNVKLKAVNKCGSDSFEVKIVVFPNTIVPKLIVDGSSNYGCAPIQVRLVNNTVGANKFTINFGDGSLPYLSNKNPDTVYHTYQTGGIYTATMKAENGCTDSTASLSLIFYDKPTANFSTTFNQYCKKEIIQFRNLSDSTLSFEWWFGDGGTSTNLHPTHRYLNAGKYTITLIVKSTNPTGAVCTDTIRKTITVHDLPISSFTNNAAIQNCQPYYFVGTTNLLPSEIANWTFSDTFSNDTTQAGNVGVHTFKQVGIYRVQLVIFNVYGCTDTSSTNVKVIETPKVAFVMSDTLSCIPGKFVICTNQTTYSSVDAVNYQWYINGVLQATTKDFSYNFNVPVTITTAANFVVKLVAINSYGCRDSATKTFVIYPKAQPSFSLNAAVGCVPFNLQFNNTTNYANVFNWYLDGQLFSTLNAPNPIVLNNSATTYNIKLVANHTLGCGADSITKQFITYTKPIADFLIPNKNSCTGILNIQCFDLSSVVGANITKWHWIFGDGATDTIKNPTHTYTTAGHFNVGLIATDNRGCKSDITYQRVANFGKPKANFSVGNVCVKNPLLPVNLSTPGLGSTSITNYLWNFGDGNYLTGSQPIYVYQNEGIYTMILIVTSDSSCVADTLQKTVTVYGKPTADFKFENNCVKENTLFTNTSLHGFGQSAIGNSKWTFGDGGTSNNYNAAHIFNATGDYVVQLAVSGNRCPNLLDSIKKTVTVFKPRDPVIYPRIEGVRGTPIQLYALSGGVQYNWIPITGLDNAGIQNPI
ncbi:MAG: PKD domain-containing protein, partial [Dolichospermum sp.]